MDFIIYEYFSDFKENFRDHFAEYKESYKDSYVDFLKNYKSCYDQVYMEYDFVIGKATETGIFTASLESEEERREREKEIYEELLPKLKFPQNRNLVEKYLDNIQNPITDRDAIWREDDDEIERNYFEVRRKTLRLLKKSIKLERERFMPETEKVEKSKKEDSVNDKPTDPNPDILMQGFANIEAQNFFFKLHDHYNNRDYQQANYSFIYRQMVKENLISFNIFKPIAFKSFIESDLKITVNRVLPTNEAIVFKSIKLKIEDELKDDEKPGDIRMVMNEETLVRLEKYNEIKSQFPKLNIIS